MESEITLSEYQSKIIGKDCRWCMSHTHDNEGRLHKEKVLLDTQPLEYYDHDGGYPVKGFKEKQWLYVTCPKCGYQWSLKKLGV